MAEALEKKAGIKLPVIGGGAVALLLVNVLLSYMIVDFVTSLLIFGCGFAAGKWIK